MKYTLQFSPSVWLSSSYRFILLAVAARSSSVLRLRTFDLVPCTFVMRIVGCLLGLIVPDCQRFS
ncbi:MAG: hypothetical protein J4215_00765 [Candidatus Diapherotrites archaeon]|uniref:Uncharacterized protein n=1 Tax=Candidatus Iainarchaeum sp. TaxID=3101447 RepID=A0A8T4L3N9_9ARCH|nr:hypothetical protein [Candidatus Diapherotrites archaeon]